MKYVFTSIEETFHYASKLGLKYRSSWNCTKAAMSCSVSRKECIELFGFRDLETNANGSFGFNRVLIK